MNNLEKREVYFSHQSDGTTIMIIPEGEVFQVYLKDEHTSYQHMFGLEKISLAEAAEIAIANYPDYLDLLEED